jgi:DTW domain-containing protein YfiP
VEGVDNRTEVLILQHPQEERKLLNSAKLVSMVLARSTLRVGLSWPNLRRALGRDHVTPSRWGVLYLGRDQRTDADVTDGGAERTDLHDLEGVVVLDASWKQAKTLWWRNPWLLRLRRIALNPSQSSLRPQAKRAGLATAEAIALLLSHLDEDDMVVEALSVQYDRLIIEPNRRVLSARNRRGYHGPRRRRTRGRGRESKDGQGKA